MTFSLWNPRFFLTAAHNIENLEPKDLMIGIVSVELDIYLLNIEKIIRHPEVDLALLKVHEEPESKLQFFQNVVEFQFGSPFGTWGVTLQESEGESKEPIPRALTGNLQRLFKHTFKTYSYLALELSIPIPPGMSGAPIFLQRSPLEQVIGVATGTIGTETVLDYVVTVETPERREIEKNVRIIQYGVGVYLEPLLDWLRENISND